MLFRSIFAAPKQPITQSFIKTTSNLQKIEELIAADSPVLSLIHISKEQMDAIVSATGITAIRSQLESALEQFSPECTPVSYTHLDVYKRQVLRGYPI